MKYVDDLTAVNPEDIQYTDACAPIQTIIKTRNPEAAGTAVVVVFENGQIGSYTLDGRFFEDGVQRFIFKPKKRLRLKPLHVVLQEQNMVWVRDHFEAKDNTRIPFIVNVMFDHFGSVECEGAQYALHDALVWVGAFAYSNDWFEEVSE